MITAAQIRKLAPGARPALVEAVVRGWPKAMAAGISTNRRTRHFLAQIMGETGGLRAIEENLNYTTTAQLRKTWPTRFKTDASAKPYVRQPKKLAIFVYGGRMGNAPHPSTDGWDYRGGGMLQTTGREGYRKLGFEDNPEALRDPDAAFASAVQEWDKRKLNALADKDDVLGIRKKINGGTNGLPEVKTWLSKAEVIWPDDGVAPPKVAPVPQPRPAAKPVTITDEGTVEHVQQRLFDLGYTEVGGIDGQIGRLTRAAILAFRDENGLPLTSTIDHALLVALVTAPVRQLDEGREEAAPAAVRQKVPEVNSNWLTKVGSAIAAVVSLGVGAIQGVLGMIPQAKDVLEPVQLFVGDVPPTVWLLLIGVVAFTFFWISRKGEREGIAAFQSGARR